MNEIKQSHNTQGKRHQPVDSKVWWNPLTWFYSSQSAYPAQDDSQYSQTQLYQNLYTQQNAASLWNGYAYGGDYNLAGNADFPNQIPGALPEDYLVPDKNGKIIINGTANDDQIRLFDGDGPDGAPAVIVSVNGKLSFVRLQDAANLEIYGGEGNDTIDASTLASTSVKLFGEDGDDHLIGTLFDDSLDGGKGMDVIEGNGGSDIINVADKKGSDRVFADVKSRITSDKGDILKDPNSPDAPEKGGGGGGGSDKSDPGFFGRVGNAVGSVVDGVVSGVGDVVDSVGGAIADVFGW